MRPADWGWLAIAVFAAGHNTMAAGRGQQMLSERVDDYLAAHPWLTRTVIAGVALHLANLLPKPADPLYQIGTAAQKIANLTHRVRGVRRDVGTPR